MHLHATICCRHLCCLFCRYTNTSAVISRISFIDGDKGILRYRGYPIEDLTEASYLESAYLVLYGNLPNRWAELSLSGYHCA